MTNTADAGDGVPRAVCLFCRQDTPLIDNTLRTVEHEYQGSECPGGGYVSAKHVGSDKWCRIAITKHRELLAAIAYTRNEMTTTTEWDYATQVDYWASRLIPLEIEAGLWHKLTVSGDPWAMLGDAISHSIYGESTFLTQMQRLGYRHWLTSIRLDLQASVVNMGPAGEILSNLLHWI